MTNEPESSEFRYKVPIDQCDVADCKKLEHYRKKRYEWLSWYELRKDEPNTIQQQIFSMMFLDMAYRTLASARQSKQSVAASSGLLAHVLDQGCVAIQVLAIRKLLDKGKDVFSLRRLFRRHRHHSHQAVMQYRRYERHPKAPNSMLSFHFRCAIGVFSFHSY